MMKYLILASLFTLLLLPLPAKVGMTLSSDFTYDNNVFQLSQNDLDRYDQQEPTLAYIQTTDDMIWNASLKVNDTFRFHKLRLNPSLKVAGNKYFSNVDKSNYNMLGALAATYRKMTLNLAYGYYPDNYSRKYKDTDGTGNYEKFSYDKNLTKADFTIPFLKTESAQLYYKYEEYFYNEYFTEFDGTADTWGLTWTHSDKSNTLSAAYFYKNFDNDSNISSGAEGDASYESNIYQFDLTLKQMELSINTHHYNLRPYAGLTIENRFYQGINTNHSGREDTITDMNAGLKFPYSKKLDIRLDFSRTVRNVSPSTLSIARSKEYSENQVTLGFSYDFTLLP